MKKFDFKLEILCSIKTKQIVYKLSKSEKFEKEVLESYIIKLKKYRQQPCQHNQKISLN